MNLKGPANSKPRIIEMTPERAEIINSFFGKTIIEESEIGDSFTLIAPGELVNDGKPAGCSTFVKSIFMDRITVGCSDSLSDPKAIFNSDCYKDYHFALKFSCDGDYKPHVQNHDQRDGAIFMGALYGFENLNLDLAPDADMLIEASNLKQALMID